MMNFDISKEAAKHSMTKKLNTETVCFYYGVFNYTGGHKSLQNCALKYIQRWFCYLTENNKHLDLSFDQMINILSSSRLDITSELEVFNAAEAWIHHNAGKRSRFARELIGTVRLSLLSPAALDSMLKNGKSLVNCRESKEYIENAITEMKSPDSVSAGCQYRYCNQDSYDVAIVDTKHCSYCTYELKEKNLCYKNEIARIKKQNSNMFFLRNKSMGIYSVLYTNGVVYLFSSYFMFSYCVFTKQMKGQTQYPAHFYDFETCSFMGKIYIFNRDSKQCIIYHPRTNTWERKAAKKYFRRGASFAVFGGKIVASGGFNFDKLNEVEVYDHCSDEWSPMPDMLESRSNHASIGIKNKLYMIGGAYDSRCEVFDIFSQMFTRILPETTIYDYNSFNTECITVGNKIVVFSSLYYRTAVFNVEKEEWSNVKDFKTKQKGSSYLCLKVPKVKLF